MTNIQFTPKLAAELVNYITKHQGEYLQGWDQGRVLLYVLVRNSRGELFVEFAKKLVRSPLTGEMITIEVVDGILLAERVLGIVYVKAVSAESPMTFRRLVKQAFLSFGKDHDAFAGMRRGKLKIYKNGHRAAERLIKG